MTQTQPPLTRLRFKNWRSLKDVEIDFDTPITVFIGANSSGKTNIVDGFYFLRQAVEDGTDTAYASRGWLGKVITSGTPTDESLELEFSYTPHALENQLTYTFREVYGEDTGAWSIEYLQDESKTIWLKSDFDGIQVRDRESKITNTKNEIELGLSVFGRSSTYPQIQNTFQFITQRWQLLDEGFSPNFIVPAGNAVDLYLLDRCAHNLPVLLEFMYKRFPELYTKLQQDFQWLTEHIDTVQVERTDRETRFFLTEKIKPEREAPTISAGTGRILAMVTAFYTLNMRLESSPGLVVIEEPDTALNPGLLERFVEQLRYYVSGEHPRQIILTTHNPAFLDYFKPEEVRVVKRDEHGYTHVERIPAYVEEIWLKNGEYGLGQAWMSNAFGGVAE